MLLWLQIAMVTAFGKPIMGAAGHFTHSATTERQTSTSLSKLTFSMETDVFETTSEGTRKVTSISPSKWSSSSPTLSFPYASSSTRLDQATSSPVTVWKDVSFGMLGTTLLFIITTVVAIAIACKFKRHLGTASRTLYPVNGGKSAPTDDFFQDVEGQRHAEVELRSMQPSDDHEEVDSPSLNLNPPMMPPRQSVPRPETEAPALPERRKPRSLNSTTNINKTVDLTPVANHDDIKRGKINVTKPNAVPIVKVPTNVRHKLAKGASIESESSDVYEQYDNDLLEKIRGSAVEESEAYEEPHKTRTFTNTSEFIRRQSSMTGLPEMAVKVTNSVEKFTDTPLKNKELSETQEIETLNDLMAYDDAEVITVGHPLDAVNTFDDDTNGLYEDQDIIDDDNNGLYEDQDIIDDMPALYDDADYDKEPIVGLSNPVMHNSGLPIIDSLDRNNTSDLYESNATNCAKQEVKTEFTPQTYNGDDLKQMDTKKGEEINQNDVQAGTTICSALKVPPPTTLVDTNLPTVNDDNNLIDHAAPLPIDVPVVPPRRDLFQPNNNFDFPPARKTSVSSSSSNDALMTDNILRAGKSIRVTSAPRDSYFLDMTDRGTSMVIDMLASPEDPAAAGSEADIPPGLGIPPALPFSNDGVVVSDPIQGGFYSQDIEWDKDASQFDNEDIYDCPPPSIASQRA